jgi:hypothetical protein
LIIFLKSIKFDQKLIQSVILFILTSFGSNSVNFVYKYNSRFALSGLLKKLFDIITSLTSVLTLKLASRFVKKWHSGLVSQSFGKHSFSCTWFSIEKNPLSLVSSMLLVQFLILKVFENVLQLIFILVNPDNITKLCIAWQLGSYLALLLSWIIRSKESSISLVLFVDIISKKNIYQIEQIKSRSHLQFVFRSKFFYFIEIKKPLIKGPQSDLP